MKYLQEAVKFDSENSILYNFNHWACSNAANGAESSSKVKRGKSWVLYYVSV